MDKRSNSALGSPILKTLPVPESHPDLLQQNLGIADRRIAQFLLVLDAIDTNKVGLETLSQDQLGEIVSETALACGFNSLDDARRAIVSTMDAIEQPLCLSRDA